nr:hypothetical protein [Phytoactinopolyspora halophila]
MGRDQFHVAQLDAFGLDIAHPDGDLVIPAGRHLGQERHAVHVGIWFDACTS